MLLANVTPRARTRRPLVLHDTPLPVLPVTIMTGDLSLTNTGISIYREGDITTWSLAAPGKKVGMARLLYLRNEWADVIARYAPDVIAVEGYAFGAKSRGHSLGEWGGIAKLAAMESGARSFIVPPTSVKKFITGAGNAKKNIIPLHLFKRYGIEIEQEDEADAACVSILIGAYLYGDAFTLTAFQKDALTKGVERMV